MGAATPQPTTLRRLGHRNAHSYNRDGAGVCVCVGGGAPCCFVSPMSLLSVPGNGAADSRPQHDDTRESHPPESAETKNASAPLASYLERANPIVCYVGWFRVIVCISLETFFVDFWGRNRGLAVYSYSSHHRWPVRCDIVIVVP